MKKIVLISLFLFLISLHAQARPPYTTDDPDVTAVGALETYIFFQFVNSTPAVTGIIPGLEVNYGLFDWLQLHMIAPLSSYSDAGGIKAAGFGDLELGLKARFLPESDIFPQAGIFPHVELPTGDADRRLGSGKARVFIPLWLQKTWTNFSTYGGAGYWIEQAADRQNWWYAGWVLRLKIDTGLLVGLELNYNTAQYKTGPPMNSANIGFEWDFAENQGILLSYGMSMFGDETYTGYLGYRLTLK